MKKLKLLLTSTLLFAAFVSFAQQTVKGIVKDKATGEGLPGVSVVIKNTTKGTYTDFDGNFMLDNVKIGDIIVCTYIGFNSKEIILKNSFNLIVELEESAERLDEIVVVGYGTTTVKDATGSVDVISSKDFNKGSIVSTDQLLNGKAAGIRITNAGGSPDSAPNIRIRGGSSLNAQNSPLIVIDGVPIGNDNPAGVSNPLTLVNPNDIESFSILKDASATAIYGSRASNGVIIITTKKGVSGKFKYNFSTDTSISDVREGLDMMTGSEYVRFIQEFYPSRIQQLGVPSRSIQTTEQVIQTIDNRTIYNTNWRDAIFRTAITSNTNFSARGNIFEKIPFRGSIGYTNAEGIVKTDDYERVSASFKLTPKLLEDNLKIDINAKAIFAEKNAIDADGAIGEALSFDPTKPVFDTSSNNRFGGYYLTTFDDGNFRRIFQSNPLARLEQRERPERVFRFLGNMEFDYTMPFLPELKAVVNLGLDASRSKIEERFSDNAFETYRFDASNSDIESNFVFNPGVNFRERQNITNTTFDAYLKYTKELKNNIVSRYDVQAGYAYQNFKNDGNQDRFQYNPNTGLREVLENPANPTNRYYNELNLQSFFARTNITINEKYLVTVSFRADGSSLFTKNNRWGYFPAAALAWQIDEEKFLANSKVIQSLKLRLGWGETGQQDITGAVGYYPSIPLFLAGDANSQYLPNSSLYSALPFNPNLTWEKTSTFNIGVDFALLKNNLISGSLDFYRRNTRDLLAEVPTPPGQALTNAFIDNVGKTESEGFELNTNINPISTKNFSFSINSNLSYNKIIVTDLEGANNIIVPESGLRGTGSNLLRHAVGQQAGSAFVFRQIYDQSGNPIPNAFVDINGDNRINNDDRYYKQIAPNWTYGFGLNFTYKNWDLSSSFRGQIGGNVYNLPLLNYGFTDSATSSSQNNLTNVLNFYSGAANSVFGDVNVVNGNGQFSDYYLEDASFLRCDNIALGYQFGDMIKNGSVRLYGSVTNPFIITNYSGQDPENFDGIDNNFYPRPTVYTIGINLDF